MSAIITTHAQLEALPVGTRLLDREGDTLRRTPDGWTYTAEGAVVNRWNYQPTTGVLSFMPMVTLDDSAASDLAAKLSDPNLTEALVDLIQSRPNEPTQEDDYETVRLIRDTLEGWIPQR